VVEAVEQGKDYEVRAGKVALKYLFTWLGIFLAGGLLGLTMRSQQANLVNVGDSTFYTMMTVHGQFMFLGLGTFGAFGMTWYVLAKALKRDLDYRFIDFIYWVLVLGFGLIGISGLYGGFAAGWYFLYPLPLFSVQDQWTNWGVALFSLGELLLGLAIILYCIEIIAVLVRWGGGGVRSLGAIKKGFATVARGLGLDGLGIIKANPHRLDPATFPLVANAVDMIVATPPLAALLLVMFIGAAINPKFGLNVGLADNMFWFFGHPIVYDLLFPAAATLYLLFETYSNREWIGYTVTGAIWILATVTNLLVWSHHLYLYPFEPLSVDLMGQLSTMGISIVSAVSVFALLAIMWKSGVKIEPPIMFGLMALFAWLEAGYMGVGQAIVAWNLTLHNTLWIVGHFHIMALMNIAMVAIGLIYYLVPRIYPYVNLYDKWSKAHFWMTLVGGFGFTNVWVAEGVLGVPRRYAYHYTLQVFGMPVTSLDFVAVVFAIILGIAQGIFAVKLFYELVIKRIRIMAEEAEKSAVVVRGG